MNNEQHEWVHSIGGQQALLSVHTILLSKKSNDIITLKDLKTPLLATSEQLEACADHLVHIDVLNEFKGGKTRTFSLYR